MRRKVLEERLREGQYGTNQADSRDAAVKVVRRALKLGHIRRPKKCPLCKVAPGVNAKGYPQIQAVHLNGYGPDKRFDFKWMCVSCRSKAVWAKKKRSA